MKTQRMIIALTFVMIMFMATGTVLADLNAGLVAHYSFNGNADDESGNANHGTVNGATLTYDRFGNAVGAYSFDGVDDYIDLPLAVTAGLAEWTVSLWIKTAESGTHSTYYRRPTIIGNATSGYGSDDLQMTTNNGYIGMYHGYNGGSDEEYLSTTTQINDSIWHQLVMLHDGTEVRLYVDNILEATLSNSDGSAMQSTKKTWIGVSGEEAGNWDHHSGIYDDVRIYNRALTATEIQELYQGTNAGLVAHYPFNGNANDESGMGNHGTVNGATLTYDRFGNADSAYDFDGTNDYINVGVNGVNLSGGTVLVRALFRSFPQTGYLYAHRTPNIDNRIYVKAQSGTGEFQTTIGTGLDDAGYTIPTDEWHHYGLTWDAGANWKCYVDGILKNSGTSTLPTEIAPSATLGDYIEQTGGAAFDGLIDDVRIYNRALTASEIQELYQGPSPGGSGDGHSLDAADGSQTDVVYVNDAGNVGIGTTNPGYKLAVDGTIKTREVIVDTTGWSDFVFKEDYALMPLGQLEKYIKSNRHLPQIPSAEDVAVKGVKIGSMQSKLLQKIEELTLYMIKLEKKTEMFEKENEMLKKRLKALEKGKM